MLISPVRAVVQVLYLPSGGQFGYRNHAINFAADTMKVVNQLPRALSDSGYVVSGHVSGVLPPLLHVKRD